MKKILSMILAVWMIVSAGCCVTAFADDEQEETQGIHVPQIRVVTENGNGTTLQKEDGYVNAVIEITDTNGEVITENVEFKVRGNGTALSSILKKAYTFKFSKKRDLFGMGKGKKWALLANAMDVTLLRTYITLDFAQQMGIRYTSEHRMVELWLDGSFRGLYELTEPVQEGKDRVNIDIESNDGKKDFMLELESSRTEAGITYFKAGDIRFAISEPEEPSADQAEYIRSTTRNIVNTIMNGTEEEIRAAIDVDSFAKFYLLNEYVKTVDFDFSSVYFYYQDGKLCAGPPWDYDHSMGSGGDVASSEYKKPAATEGVFAGNMHLYRYLCQYDWFMDEVKDIFAQYRDYIADIALDGGLLDRLAAEYSSEIERNYTETEWKVSKRWSVYQRKPLPTYQENLDFLKDWCSARFEWLDDYLSVKAQVDYYCGDADGDGKITILDATAIQRVLAGYVVRSFNENAADVDGERLEILDATLIQRYLAGYSSPYPIGEPVFAAPDEPDDGQ